MNAIVRYHIQRGNLYLGDDRHATDDVQLWCEWGNPFVCGFLDFETADYWRRQNDGSRMRVSINGELVTSRDEAIAQERERCAKYCETMAAYWARHGNESDAATARDLAIGIRGEGC